MTPVRCVAGATALALAAYSVAKSIGVATANDMGKTCAKESEDISCLGPLDTESAPKASEGLLGGLSLGDFSSYFFRK